MPFKNKEIRNKWASGWAKKNRQKLYEQKQKRKIAKAGRPKPERCEICDKKPWRMVFDHDHKTGEFRGWICHGCNTALGHVKDDPGILWRLGAYIMQHEAKKRARKA